MFKNDTEANFQRFSRRILQTQNFEYPYGNDIPPVKITQETSGIIFQEQYYNNNSEIKFGIFVIMISIISIYTQTHTDTYTETQTHT